MATPAPPTAQPHLPFPLQDGEAILRICRRHWVYLWPNILLHLVWAIVPPLVVALILSAAGAYEGTAANVFWIVAAVYLAYWAVRIFLVWYRYRHDLWVVTNQRIVDSFKSNPFSLRISTADLVNVQDMTVVRDGILRTALDYGDIICQTAAENQDFRLVGIPDPREVQALVDRERDRERLRLR
jgi:hypothetical protein